MMKTGIGNDEDRVPDGLHEVALVQGLGMLDAQKALDMHSGGGRRRVYISRRRLRRQRKRDPTECLKLTDCY